MINVVRLFSPPFPVLIGIKASIFGLWFEYSITVLPPLAIFLVSFRHPALTLFTLYFPTWCHDIKRLNVTLCHVMLNAVMLSVIAPSCETKCEQSQSPHICSFSFYRRMCAYPLNFLTYVAKAPKIIRRKFHKNVLIIPGAIFTTLHFLCNLIMDPII